MSRALLCLSVLVLGLAPLPLKAAAPPCPGAGSLQVLLRLLDDDDYRVRERAEHELGKLDSSHIPGLRQALAATTSAEVRRRLGRVLYRLSYPERTRTSQRQAELLRLIEALKSSSSQKDRAQALRRLNELSGPDLRLLRSAIPFISDPTQRRHMQIIVDYFDALERRRGK